MTIVLVLCYRWCMYSKLKLGKKLEKRLAGIIAEVARQQGVSEAECREEMQKALDEAWPTMQASGEWGEKPSLELFIGIVSGRISAEELQQKKEMERQVQFYSRHNKKEKR